MAKKQTTPKRRQSDRDGYPKKVRAISDGRRKKRTPPPEDPIQTASIPPGQVTNFKPNGLGAIQPAPEPLTEDLGPLRIPQGEDAERAMRELAELNDRAIKAKTRMERSKATAKADKDSYDALAEQVLTRLRQWTHGGDLPLFDQAEREADQVKMESAIEAGGTVADSAAPADAPASDPEADKGEGAGDTPPAVLGALDGSEADAEEVPF